MNLDTEVPESYLSVTCVPVCPLRRAGLWAGIQPLRNDAIRFSRTSVPPAG